MSSGSSSDLYDSTQAQNNAPLQQQDTSSAKRILEDANDGDYSDKRAKTESPAASSSNALSASSRFSAAVWQRIFSYLPPPSLGRLMLVSKDLRSCLDGTIPPNLGQDKEFLKTVDAETIWAQWRTSNAQNMPKPLQGLSERDMWKLIRGFRCEMCEKLDEQPRQPTSPDLWHGGPQMSTTRAIWPFGARYCAECCFRSCERVSIRSFSFASHTLTVLLQDTKLLCTPVKAFMSALPYAFFTHDWHYVPTTVVKGAGTAPHGVHLTKQFLNLHSEHILKEYEEVKALGAPAAEEWSKGLAGMGKLTMEDAARWEHWEIKGGLNYINAMLAPPPPQALVPPSQPPPTASQPWIANTYAWSANSMPQFHQPQPVSLAQTPNYFTSSAGQYHQPQTSPISLGPTPFSQPANTSTPHAQPPNQYPQHTPQPMSQTQLVPQRVERNVKDAQAAKAARRKAIEERAYSDAGILPNVLRHMESFQAAIQISVPMTDSGWEVLKPRLLAQRETAEGLEREYTAQLLALKAETDAQNTRNPYSKEAKDAQEREWEEALKPVYDKLSLYADRHITDEWRGGQSVNNGNVARFAISVFHHVRKQFYSELDIQDLLTRASGQQIRYDPPDGPYLRKLTLEMMKWVYDHKIRHLSRDFGKEIFFCSGEGCEGNNKFYAFEGVIQHFSAKHTYNFTKGNVVVHWQTAEWPEELPFFDPGSGPPRPQTNGGYSRGTTITPQVMSGAPFSAPSLATSPYGQTSYPEHTNGPFPPPTNGNLAAFQNASMPQARTSQNITPSFDKHDLSQFFKGAMGGLATAAPTSPAAEVSPGFPPNDALGVTTAIQTGSGPATKTKARLFDTDMPDFEVYQDQLKHIADTAKSAWNSTSAILGMPQSVRVFAVIHHTVSQFSTRFDVELSLETFTAALTNNPLLDPLKIADGLVCHICAMHSANAEPGSSSALMIEPVDLTRLISHFKSIHIDASGPLSLPHLRTSWAKEMISLPANNNIAEIVNAAGMTEDKYAFFADAFSDFLPRRLPRHKEVNGRPPKQKNNRRFGRKSGGSKRFGSEDPTDQEPESEYPLWDPSPSKPEAQDPGYNGFSHRSQSPPGPGVRRRTPKLYDDESEQYDPAKPALVAEPARDGRKRAHDRPRMAAERKRSGANADLAALIMNASEEANRAAEEENRRRGIRPETYVTAPSTQPVMYEQLPPGRAYPPESRSDSANKPRYATAPGMDGNRWTGNMILNLRSARQADNRLADNPSPSKRGNGGRIAEYGSPGARYVERPSPPYLRPLNEYAEVSYNPDDPVPRARSSRYARYDEQRERMLRERSRSPARGPEVQYAGATLREFPRQRDYATDIRQAGQNSQAVEYRYADEPEPIYVDQYGRPVRLVRVDEPRPRYVSHNRGEQLVEYVDRRPVYDDRAHVYYEDERTARAAPDPRYDTRSLPMPP